MKLRQLEYVAAIVEHGTMAAAADELHVAQPAVSQGIRRLEAELGVRVFERVGRRLELTAAGEEVLATAQRIGADLAALPARAASRAWTQAGNVELALREGLAVDPGMALLGAFRKAHPDVRVRVSHADDHDEVAMLVRSQAAHAGVTDRPDLGDDLVAHHLTYQRVRVALPPGTPAPEHGITLERLAEFPLLASPTSDPSRRRMDEAFATVGRQPNVVFESSERSLWLPLIAAGEGAALVTGTYATQAAELGAVVVDFDPPIFREVVLVVRADAASAQVAWLVDSAAALMPALDDPLPPEAVHD